MFRLPPAQAQLLWLPLSQGLGSRAWPPRTGWSVEHLAPSQGGPSCGSDGFKPWRTLAQKRQTLPQSP